MKVLIVSQQPILIRGIETILSSTRPQRLEMAAYGGPAADLTAVVQAEGPDVLLIDFDPAEDFGTVLDMRERQDQCRIVLLTRDISPELAYQSLTAGVRGILRASTAGEQLVECLEAVHSGERWCDDDLKKALFNAKTAILSPRESQLVVLISQGLKNKEISAALSISEATVRIYLSSVFQRLGVKDRYELAIYGLRTFVQDPRVPQIGIDQSLLASDGSAPIRFLMFEKPRPKQAARATAGIKRLVGAAR